MKDPDSPPAAQIRSALGFDTSVKRGSGAKYAARQSRTSGGMVRSSSGNLWPTPSRTNAKRLLVFGLLALVSVSTIFLFRDVTLFPGFAKNQDENVDSRLHREMLLDEQMLGSAAEKQQEMEEEEEQRREGDERRHRRSKSKDASKLEGKEHEERHGKRNKKRGKSTRRSNKKKDELPPIPRQFNPLDPVLPSGHACANFTLPPPPMDRKRTGPRPCPVCYLPAEAAMVARPAVVRDTPSVVKHLTYVTQEDEGEQAARQRGRGPRFSGYQSKEQRRESFQLKESMRVHCGFVWGRRPGSGTGFDFSDRDHQYMEGCRDVVVASAIFGAYDLIQQPQDMSEHTRKHVCFVMFVDEATFDALVNDGTLKDRRTRYVGLWRLVVVSNLPYKDPRRTGKIPKMLLHRLFPRAQYSLWIDAKLELRVDPYRLLERFLWRGNFTWAISKHYKRFDVFEEAERNKEAGKYDNRSIDAQMDVYRREGMTPYSEAKLPIISDVPEGCTIIRAHTPMSNLLACIWFNEVDRFTSRDQLSFGFSRDRIRAAAPGWNVNMFLDCERRNFVVQVYHKDVLLKKFGNASVAIATDRLEEKGRRPSSTS